MLLLSCSKCRKPLPHMQGFVGQDGTDLLCVECEMDRALTLGAEEIAARMITLAYDSRRRLCDSDNCSEPAYRDGYCRQCYKFGVAEGWIWIEEEDCSRVAPWHTEQSARERQDAEAMDNAGVRPALVHPHAERAYYWILAGLAAGVVVIQVCLRLGWLP